MGDDWKFVAGVLAVFASIALIVMLGFHLAMMRDIRTAEMMGRIGYQQVMVPGRASPVWQRACPCDSVAVER